MALNTTKSTSALIWAIAELLRGNFRQHEYGKVILPFVVLRRLDCLLEKSKPAVLKKAKTLHKGLDDEAKTVILSKVVGQKIKIYNLSKYTFATLRNQDAKDIHENLIKYITDFSSNIRDVFLEKFLFPDSLKRLDEANLLYKVFDEFAKIDLHPNIISNVDMGYIFEELIRKFAEMSNETAGEHFTPREVIRLMVSLLLINDKEALTKKGAIRQVYDPAAGTGGMLAITEMNMKEFNPDIRVELYGQEINPESYATCKSDMLVTGHDSDNIAFGNSLTEDAQAGKTFHYMLSNPPYGVDWKKYAEPIKDEHEEQGEGGRFGAGLPRISDGQLLFLQHMISKMRNDEQGTRIGIVMNASPLFNGGAGSGESEIRRWMFEKDLVEAIIALPTDLFFNTGIQTYVWLLNNRKVDKRVNKVQLIDASGEKFWKSMRKNLGSKRKEIPQTACAEITKIYSKMLNGNGEWGEYSKILATSDFAYREVRVERPLRLSFAMNEENINALKLAKPFMALTENEQQEILDCLNSNFNMGRKWADRKNFLYALDKAIDSADVKITSQVKKSIVSAFGKQDKKAEICRDSKGNIEPDTNLRDQELVPFGENYKDYIEREVIPFAPDAWVDEKYADSKDGKVGKIGYEINFNRYFYNYIPPRSITKINSEMNILEKEISNLFQTKKVK